MKPFLVLTLFSSLSLASAAPFNKVFTVVFENADYVNALKEPFFKSLAERGALLTNFHAEAHPSQANYIAMIGGDTLGVTGDGTVTLSQPTLVNLLEKAKRTWRVYAEGYPGNCFMGKKSGKYVRKHNPFISFTTISSNSDRCKNIVDASQLGADIKAGALADYSFYIPDMDNDGHDTGVQYADAWFSKNFGRRLSDPLFMNGMLLVATFDESSPFEPTNRIYTVLVGDSIVSGSTSEVRYDHYSLLRLVEEAWNLGSLTTKDSRATPITGVWK